MTFLRMPDGRMVAQGGAEDRATWWRCTACGFLGPNVGTDAKGRRVCMGVICGGTVENPDVPRHTSPRQSTGPREGE